jgi:glycine cleavage system H protein
MIPENLRYSTEHEWIRVENSAAVLGITHFAQDSLGDIVYVDLPKAGAQLAKGKEIGEVESTKTTSPVYTPVAGKILEVNTALKDHPEIINQDPYGKGWIVKLQMADPKEAGALMDAAAYAAFLKEQDKH